MRQSSHVHLHAVGSEHRALLGRVCEDGGERASFWALPEADGELDLECGTAIGLDDPEGGAAEFDPAAQVLVSSGPSAELMHTLDREHEVEDAAWAISARPFYSIFAAHADPEEQESITKMPKAGHPSPQPPTSTHGGRSLPTLCLTPRLLAQRPQAARARAGCPC